VGDDRDVARVSDRAENVFGLHAFGVKRQKAVLIHGNRLFLPGQAGSVSCNQNAGNQQYGLIPETAPAVVLYGKPGNIRDAAKTFFIGCRIFIMATGQESTET